MLFYNDFFIQYFFITLSIYLIFKSIPGLFINQSPILSNLFILFFVIFFLFVFHAFIFQYLFISFYEYFYLYFLFHFYLFDFLRLFL